MERDNETFHEIMIYARAFLSFTVITLFLRNVWNTLLTTFGINTRIYGAEQEEKRKMEAQEERWKSEKDKQNYREWLKNHRK